MLFNASKAYVRQLGKSIDYDLLQPVYSLNLVNDIFEPDDRRTSPCVHRAAKVQATQLQRKEDAGAVAALPHGDIRADTLRAAGTAGQPGRESAFTDAELEGYDKFWDAIRVECTLVNSIQRRYKEGLEKGMEDGMEKGMEKGMAKGREEGRAEGMVDVARNLKQMGLPISAIAQATGLSPETIEQL